MQWNIAFSLRYFLPPPTARESKSMLRYGTTKRLSLTPRSFLAFVSPHHPKWSLWMHTPHVGSLYFAVGAPATQPSCAYWVANLLRAATLCSLQPYFWRLFVLSPPLTAIRDVSPLMRRQHCLKACLIWHIRNKSCGDTSCSSSPLIYFFSLSLSVRSAVRQTGRPVRLASEGLWIFTLFARS